MNSNETIFMVGGHQDVENSIIGLYIKKVDHHCSKQLLHLIVKGFLYVAFGLLLRTELFSDHEMKTRKE